MWTRSEKDLKNKAKDHRGRDEDLKTFKHDTSEKPRITFKTTWKELKSYYKKKS